MDKQALKILLTAYWSSKGWKDVKSPDLSADEFAYAKSKKVMFDPVTLDHDEAIDRLTKLINSTSRRQVADAFLSSLSTQRLDWRSPLGTYAVFQHIHEHGVVRSEGKCAHCGFSLESETDLNVLSFERHKWGGVRHDQVDYALLDLEQHRDVGDPRPTAQDISIFKAIIHSIETAAPSVSSAALHSSFAKLLPSNKSERDRLIAILGFCGILGTPAHPGYSDAFVEYRRRELPNRHFVEMSYPACWWTRSAGVNQAKLQDYFGHVL